MGGHRLTCLIHRVRRRVDDFPTHKWMARIVLPLFIIQRKTQVVNNETFDSLMIGYLWWLSERTADDSWAARRASEEQVEEGRGGPSGNT